MPTKNTSQLLVREYIYTALMLLLEKEEFSKITITDITRKAGVSRMAYYRNYTSKESILIQHCDELFDQSLALLETQPDLSQHNITQLLFAFFKRNRKFLQAMRQAGLFPLLLDCFVRYGQTIYRDYLHWDLTSPELLYSLHYQMGGLHNTLMVWLDRGMQESVKEIAGIVYAQQFTPAPKAEEMIAGIL